MAGSHFHYVRVMASPRVEISPLRSPCLSPVRCLCSNRRASDGKKETPDRIHEEGMKFFRLIAVHRAKFIQNY